METEVQHMRDYSRELAAEVDAFFLSQQNLTHYANISAELRNYLAQTQHRPAGPEFSGWLTQWKSISDSIDEVYVLNAVGDCVAATNAAFVGKSYAFRPYFKQAIAGKDYASDWSIGVTSRKAGLYFSTPIRLGRHVGGVLVIKVDPVPLERIIRRSSSLGKQAFIANQAGVLLAHDDPSIRYATVADLTASEQADIQGTQQFADLALRSLKLYGLRADMARVQPRETVMSRVYHFGGDQKIAALTGVQSRNWVVGVTVPFSKIEAPARQVVQSYVPLVVVILLFAVISSFYVSRHLIRPLTLLLTSMARFGAGEQTVRAAAVGHDEVGRLAVAFNAMAEQISRQTNDLEVRVAERTHELKQAFEEIKRISITDPLTGCFNRRYMDEHLAEELARWLRYPCELSVVMCDMDHFKRVNDQHGHQAGDRVLVAVAKILQDGLRQQIDWVARFGGEEFLLVLPQTSLNDAVLIAERIRQAVENGAIHVDGSDLRISASFGVTTCRTHQPESVDTLLARADGYLYQAKDAGRNRVVSG
jgi:diguanylate cyclase (GGDEF)-like protein